jgi:hypothetical protein
MKTNRRATMIDAGENALPAELEDAVTQAEQVLAERDHTFGVLQQSHVRIPELLAARTQAQAALGNAEISHGDTGNARKRLDAINVDLASQVRARMAAIDALVGMDSALVVARDGVDAARLDYAASIAAAFEDRYSQAIATLQALWLEGNRLAFALRVKIEMEVPRRIEGSEPAAAPAIDSTAARIGSALDKLDNAIGFPRAFASMADRAEHLDRRGAAPNGFDPAATFTVMKEFGCQLSGLKFEPGMLVNSSLVPASLLARLYSSRFLRYVDRVASAA